MDRLSRRVERIEKKLEPENGERCYSDIWDESFVPKRPELSAWALGHADERPDFWLSEEQTVELRRRGYVVEDREGSRKTFEMLLSLNRRADEALARMGVSTE